MFLAFKNYLALILVLAFHLSYGQMSDSYTAVEGQIDFANWNLETEPVQALDGEWEFYWQRHIAPWDFVKGDLVDREFRDCHSTWNKYEKDGKNLPAEGFATYRLHLRNLPDTELNLMIRSLTCAVAVYADDELLAEVGQVGTKKELEIPRYEDKIVALPTGKSAITLTVFISNFHHRKGGFNDPWYIGTEEAIYRIQRQHLMLNGVEASTFLFAGLFFMTLYAFRKKDKALLYFALYALTFFIRPLVSVNYSIMSLIPDLDWHVLVHIEYLTLLLPAAFMVLFIRERYHKQAPQKLLLVLVWLVALEALITIITPISVFTWIPLPHQLLSLFTFIVFIYVVVRAMKARESGAIFAGIAIFCLIASSLYTMLFYMDSIQEKPFLYTGLQLLFLFSMTMILGSKFASQFRKVEYLMVETAEQKEQLEIQNQIVASKNDEITSSIAYARRIQNAILPPAKTLAETIPDSFILYKPKDIVAGDFYWAEQKDGKLFLAAADCTGHGVPGAMVSVVCNAALNRSIREFGLTDPAAILDKTRELVIETFDQSEEEVKDGMDIALISFEPKTREVCFSGANNPVWIVRDNRNETALDPAWKTLTEGNISLTEIKGNKQPIGKHYNPLPFESTKFTLSPNEWLYLFTDGYADQFGGDKGKKLMYKPMKLMLIELYSIGAQEQKEILAENFENWKASIEQTDDVCLIGLKLT